MASGTSRFVERYAVAVFAVCLAVVLVIVGQVAGDDRFSIASGVAMGVYAAIAWVGGRTGRLRFLRGEYDEREQRFDHRALYISSTIVGIALFVAWIRDVINGEVGTLPMWLLLLSGLSYAVSLAFFSWRDRA